MADHRSKAFNEHKTSGRHLSCWFKELVFPAFQTLNETVRTEVVIVGGGIAGLSVAYRLLQEGKKVAVVDDGHIGSGETGRTTAHLATALDDRYYELERMFGKESTRLIAGSHATAIRWIEEVVTQEKIDCDFKRLDGYLMLHPSDEEEALEKELEACTNAGLCVEMEKTVPGLKIQTGPCLRFADQAKFHPLKYLKGLAKAILDKGGLIYTNTHAEIIDHTGIVSKEGFAVKADHIVIATNTPVNNKYIPHLKQYAYRSYVIAAKVEKGTLPDLLWWDTGDQKANPEIPPYHYVRLHPLDETHDLLIAGGEDHATGLSESEQLTEEERYEILEQWTRRHFDIGEIDYRWSGQVMEPMDSLAYIGRNPMDHKNIYIVTGDSGNGMTHGTIAGLLITDLIIGRKNEWEKIYDPSRFKLFTAGKTFIKELTSGMIQYLKHKPDNEASDIENIQSGEGKVIKIGKKQYGVYKDNHQQLHFVNAECSHMKCIVKWNNDEKSWDCPCHGSRFTYDGKVVNGPANSNLDYYKSEQVMAGKA